MSEFISFCSFRLPCYDTIPSLLQGCKLLTIGEESFGIHVKGLCGRLGLWYCGIHSVLAIYYAIVEFNFTWQKHVPAYGVIMSTRSAPNFHLRS